MANRNFPSGGKSYAFHVMPVMIDGQATIGASGAVTALSNAPGIASIARTAAGKYLITLQDPYYSFCGMTVTMIKASGVSGIASSEVISSTPNTLTGGTINIQTLNAAGTPTDPASGTVMSVIIRMNNSSVQ